MMALSKQAGIKPPVMGIMDELTEAAPLHYYYTLSEGLTALKQNV